VEDMNDIENARRHFFSKKLSKKLVSQRKRKAREIIGLLGDELSNRTIKKALSIGSSFCLIEELIHETLMPQAQFFCVDLDLDALNHYEQPGLIKVCASATQLNFPEGSFDFIMAHQTLEHINNYQMVLQSMVRMCRPGGIVYINVPNPFSPYIIAKDADGCWQKPLVKQFCRRNLSKLKTDFFANTERYHTGFSETTLRRYMPGFRIIDKRRERLRQVVNSPLFNSLVNKIPDCLLFLAVSSNIWVLEKSKTE
jgi:SAM-dependent methyltransferase